MIHPGNHAPVMNSVHAWMRLNSALNGSAIVLIKRPIHKSYPFTMSETNYNVTSDLDNSLTVDLSHPYPDDDVWNNQSDVNHTMLGNLSEAENPELPPMKEDIKGLIIFMYTVVCLVGIVGNGCVIYLVLSRRQMRSVTNYFIASLATSDMLMAIVCIPVTFIANVVLDYWPFPAAMCPLVTYLQVVIVFQNAYTLLAISLERYIAIMYPFKRRLTTCQCFLVIGLCWFLALATPLPTAITSRLEEFPGEEENETLSACYEQWPTENQRFTYSMTIMVLQYFVPLVVLTYTYARIVHVVWLKDAPPHGPLRPFARPVMMRQESARRMDSKTGKYTDPRKKVIKMMITVVGIYAVCWLPLHVITILGDTKPQIWNYPSTRYVWVSTHWLAMSACVYNPIIYWWMSEKFRQGYKSVLRTIKIYCCVRGRDRMNLMLSERRSTFDTSGSYGYWADLPRLRPDTLDSARPKSHDIPVNASVETEGRESRERQRNGSDLAEASKRTEPTQTNRVECESQARKCLCETIPLRRVSDEPAESGLGTDEAQSEESASAAV